MTRGSLTTKPMLKPNVRVIAKAAAISARALRIVYSKVNHSRNQEPGKRGARGSCMVLGVRLKRVEEGLLAAARVTAHVETSDYLLTGPRASSVW